MKVSFIGAGNVATRMATGLRAAGAEVVQVQSRTPESARRLAEAVGAEAVERIDGTRADMVIVAVSDDSVLPVLDAVTDPGTAIWTHTAGSVGMDAFDAAKFPRHGIFYPLQTMSRQVEVEWSRVPMFTEASSPEVEAEIAAAARLLTPAVTHLDSEHRRQLHAAAVIGCNMVMYLWSLSEDILRSAGLDFEVMRPLLEVTLERTRTLSPTEAMTGPARRGDVRTIRKHLAALSGPAADTYRQLSQNILSLYHPDKEI